MDSLIIVLAVTMFNMYGIPYSGVDLCGFISVAFKELCTRWMQMGVFFPFRYVFGCCGHRTSRNHNFIMMPRQDPAAFDEVTADRMRSAIETRYSLFPVLYSLMYNAHLTGCPVIKPLAFNYPADASTYSIDTQFMWSNMLLISPVLQRGAQTIHVYFPEDRWYDWYHDTYQEEKGDFKDLPVTMDNIPLHVRGGSVLVLNEPRETIPDTRQTNFKIHIYLDKNASASGYLYLDNGDELGIV